MGQVAELTGPCGLGKVRIVVAPADLERIIGGLWAIHPSRVIAFGSERFRRRPMCHIVFDGPGWCLYETGWRRRFKRAGTSRCLCRTADLDGQALPVLTIRSYRPSSVSEVILESNCGYSGGTMAVIGDGCVSWVEVSDPQCPVTDRSTRHCGLYPLACNADGTSGRSARTPSRRA